MGSTVTWVDPAAPPSAPCTTLLLRRVIREGSDEQRWEGGPGEVRVVGHRLLVVRIVATGASPLDRLARLQTSLSLPSARAALTDGLALAGDEPVEAELDGESASLEITFRAPLDVLDAPGEISAVDIDGTVRRPDGAVAFTETLHFTR